MEAAREKWSRMLPDENGLWTWCLAQDKGVLLHLLAFCASATINAVRVSAPRPAVSYFQRDAARVPLQFRSVICYTRVLRNPNKAFWHDVRLSG